MIGFQSPHCYSRNLTSSQVDPHTKSSQGVPKHLCRCLPQGAQRLLSSGLGWMICRSLSQRSTIGSPRIHCPCQAPTPSSQCFLVWSRNGFCRRLWFGRLVLNLVHGARFNKGPICCALPQSHFADKPCFEPLFVMFDLGLVWPREGFQQTLRRRRTAGQVLRRGLEEALCDSLWSSRCGAQEVDVGTGALANPCRCKHWYSFCT